MKRSTVELVQVQGSVAETLEKSLKRFNLQKKKRIFLKPNICAPEYSPGAVTTPGLIYDLVSLLRNYAEEVLVGESNIYNYPCSLAFKGTGMEAAVKKAGGTVVNLSEDKVVEVKIKDSPLKKLYLAKTLLDADSIIDVPVMKTHEFKIYSGAIKNLFGCIPDSRRIFLHPQLSEVLFQLYSILNPNITIMDAMVAMEGNGPTKGKPVKLGLILTSDNSFAVDIAATKIMGINWREIDYLAHIAQKTDFKEEDIRLLGAPLTDFPHKFELPRIDLPVEAQLRIYKSPSMTKLFFYSLDVVKIFQKVAVAYRRIRAREQSV
jgi:uncharacterized protein (DUF362 family)